MDRDNVGTIRSIDDTAGLGSSDLHLRCRAQRNPKLELVRPPKPIDHPNAEPIPAAAQYWLAARRTELVDSDQAWGTALAAHGLSATLHIETRHAIEIRSARLADQLAAQPPDWLQWWLGPRPTDQAGATAWDDTIARIAAWHDRNNTPNDSARPRPQTNESRSRRALVCRDGSNPEPVEPLAQRHPQPEPAQVAALNGAALIERYAMLDQLLATAPPDCADLIDGLIAGGKDTRGAPRGAHRRAPRTSSSP